MLSFMFFFYLFALILFPPGSEGEIIPLSAPIESIPVMPRVNHSRAFYQSLTRRFPVR
jgi:hypothetical protein